MCDQIQTACDVKPGEEGVKGSLPLVEEFQPSEIKLMIEHGATFALNITAAWCNDCVDQKLSWPKFEARLKDKCVLVMSLQVFGPLEEGQKVFHSPDHEELTTLLMKTPIGSNPLTSKDDTELDRSTSVVGVHNRDRFPTTFLVIKGNIAAWDIEVKTPEALNDLADMFLRLFDQTFRR